MEGTPVSGNEKGDEQYRLIDLMPASGRMYCKIVSKPNQPQVIAAKVPLPWSESRPIAINFDRWQMLTQPQRDLLLLQKVSWLLSIDWFKPSLYQGLTAVGFAAIGWEFLRSDPAGIVVTTGLTFLAASQIWRKSRSLEQSQLADEEAIAIAQRRGYTSTEAARYLIEAIEAVALLEGRSITVEEQVRCQSLRAIGGRGD
ncbi:DUF3318 domain-containing protein [Leptolyngbya sp. FACHB-711]|uniref:DUF3318 domain-containing protein n=1 Tax=unclassified Leptolyngbya TaxID=2650499 RepID=UPI0016866AC4|nr:DUF3318 domain-containing protein [Leptolyngbya sp. FACHB-711]MBD1849236.1 DUF3318 domain-containing protein [Cyanobacteria bacterium FACHB-502]MBD2024282.1 DUF3318 domain-containing protein [Leptolyngbya sp. FACHB-711]